MRRLTAARLRILALSLQLLISGTGSAANHCIILQYHHVSTETPPVTSVTPREFELHLGYLADNGFAILPLQRVVDDLRQGHELPERCVAITFDDAYRSIFDEAFPRLRSRGWPFTVFVNTEAVDRGLRSHTTWDQMREMALAGVRIENHGHSHDHLIRRRAGEQDSAWRTRIEADILTARARIRAELGQDPRFFAYPFGEYDARLQAVVSGLGLVAFGQQSGPAWSGSDFLALPRFAMAAAYAALDDFSVKVRTLPLPVIRADPEDPLLPLDQWQPRLTLHLEPADYRPDALRCYVSGQPPGEVTWRDGEARILEVRAREPLAVGRNRYNCTAPSTRADRYYWYSHPWIRRKQDGSWYRE